MNIKSTLRGLFGKEKAEERNKHRWPNGKAKSELSKRVKEGHKATQGKRYEY